MSAADINTARLEVAKRVREARHVVLLTHQRPDGDALGSLLALARSLTARGTRAEAWLMGPIEPPLLALAGATPLRRVEEGLPEGEPDLVIVVDTDAWTQLEPIEAWLRGRRARTVVIDHHPRGDGVGAVRLVDPAAGASALLVADLLEHLGWPFGEGIFSVAEAIFVGLATDTGWFRFANAGPREFALAARLLERSIDKVRLYRVLEETFRPQRLALEARALASVELIHGGACAIQRLSRADFEATGGRVEDLTDLVNRPMVVEGVMVAALLAEVEPGRIKVSLRARPRDDGSPALDVGALAETLGGGGHVLAAGARLDATLEEAARRVEEELRKRLER